MLKGYKLCMYVRSQTRERMSQRRITKVSSTSILQVNLDRLLAMCPLRVEPHTGLNLSLGHHDAIDAQAVTPRVGLGSDNVSLDRELVRERALAGLTSDGCVETPPFVGFGVAC